MAVLTPTMAFVGLAQTEYLAGVFHAPVPGLIVHPHGAAFSCWILGIAGFLLACRMVVLGLLAATDPLVREAGPAGRDATSFYIIPLTDMLA